MVISRSVFVRLGPVDFDTLHLCLVLLKSDRISRDSLVLATIDNAQLFFPYIFFLFPIPERIFS